MACSSRNSTTTDETKTTIILSNKYQTQTTQANEKNLQLANEALRATQKHEMRIAHTTSNIRFAPTITAARRFAPTTAAGRFAHATATKRFAPTASHHQESQAHLLCPCCVMQDAIAEHVRLNQSTSDAARARHSALSKLPVNSPAPPAH
jgi:hypothetical protein